MGRAAKLLALGFALTAACGGQTRGGGAGDADGSAGAASCPESACANSCSTVTLAKEPQQSWLLAMDADTVYWSSVGSGVSAPDGKVGAVDRCGGPMRWVAAGQAAPYGLAVRSGVVCWTNLGSTVDGKYQEDGSVVCNAGGENTVLASPVGNADGIAIDGTKAYWVQTKPVSVYSRDVTGGEPPALVAAGTGYFEGAAIAVDETHVYFSMGSQIAAVPKAGGPVEIVASGQFMARWIGVDQAAIYWNDVGGFGANNRIMTAPKHGGPSTILATASDMGNQAALDESHIYFIGDSSVERVPKAGGAAEVLATPTHRYAVAVDDSFVYWDWFDGLHRRLK